MISEILMSQMCVHWLQETSEQNGEYHHHQAQCTGTKLNLSRVQPAESSENWASSVRSCSQCLQKSSIHVTSFKHVNSCNSALPNLPIARRFADHMDVLSQIAKASTITRMCFTNIRGYQKSTATITLR